MVYVAVNRCGGEFIFESLPKKGKWWYRLDPEHNAVIQLPKGTIFKLIGRNLTWDDEPVLIGDVTF